MFENVIFRTANGLKKQQEFLALVAILKVKKRPLLNNSLMALHSVLRKGPFKKFTLEVMLKFVC